MLSKVIFKNKLGFFLTLSICTILVNTGFIFKDIKYDKNKILDLTLKICQTDEVKEFLKITDRNDIETVYVAFDSAFFDIVKCYKDLPTQVCIVDKETSFFNNITHKFILLKIISKRNEIQYFFQMHNGVSRENNGSLYGLATFKKSKEEWHIKKLKFRKSKFTK